MRMTAFIFLQMPLQARSVEFVFHSNF